MGKPKAGKVHSPECNHDSDGHRRGCLRGFANGCTCDYPSNCDTEYCPVFRRKPK